jgi:uncharacterized protein (TIRG00374 family)
LKKKLLDFAKILFFLGLGAFFIWLFMHNLSAEEKKDIYKSFLKADYRWLLLSVLFGLVSHYSRAIRWKILLEPMGYQPRTRNTYMAVMIAYFANLALPRLGEVTRCGVLARYEKIPFSKSFGTVITERGLDLITLVLVFVLNFFIHFDKFELFKKTSIVKKMISKYDQLENPGIIYWIGGAALLIFIILLFKFRHKISHTPFYRKIKEIILGFYEGIKSLTKIKKPFWFVFHSILIWVMYLLMTWTVFLCLPETANLGIDIALAVLVFGSIGIVVVQGGIGIYPWIVAEILALFAIPSTKGYALGWLLWTGQTLTIVAFGILSLSLLPILNKHRNELPGDQSTENP